MHVLIIAHMLHWWLSGSTFSRFVLSDTMRTLELGEINPGAVLFALALLVTLVFGRFMCGWACHMGALQDLAAWVFRRLGRRPHFFRARLLGYIPLGLALYMFAWPTLSREVLAPVARQAWPESSLAAIPGFVGWSGAWTTGDLWEGLPGVWVAIPFLLVSGVGVVWFLGARGLCRYVCPYGGFLLPAARVAPVRVRVDAARCDQCGKCTAACTAGVRVLEQLRAHGSVIDTDCIRSLDCVAACPNGALTLRAGRSTAVNPSAAKRAEFDLTWGEELIVLGAFLATFFLTRGLYDAVPMLLAASLAAIAGYLAWKAVRLFHDPHGRVAGIVVKRHGRLTPAGISFSGSLIVLLVLGAQSLAVRGLIIAAQRHDDAVHITRDDLARGVPVDEAQRSSAARALRLYTLAGPVTRGGIGLACTPSAETRRAWLHLVLGEPDRAEGTLRELVRSDRAHEHHALLAADLMLFLGRADAAMTDLAAYVEAHPSASRARSALAVLRFTSGDQPGAEALLAARLTEAPRDGVILADRGMMRLAQGRSAEGLDDLRRAAELRPLDAGLCMTLAQELAQVGARDQALEVLRRGAERIPAASQSLTNAARHLASLEIPHSEPSPSTQERHP